MLDALATNAWKRPWALLGAALAALAVLGTLAAGARDQLGHPPEAHGSDGDILVATNSRGEVSDAVYRVALEAISARIESEPGVSGVTVAEAPGRDGIAVLAVDASGAGVADQRRLVAGLVDEIDPGPLALRVEGRIADLVAAEESVLDDLWRLELLILPLAALALLAALGPRLAAGPPLTAAIAVAGGAAGLAVAGRLGDLSVLGLVPALAVGLVLGLELCALLVGRWEDEVRLGTPQEALRNTLSEGTPTLCFVAGAAALAATGVSTLALADAFAPAVSLLVGTASASAFAVLGCLLVVPALLALDGRREEADPEPRGERRLASVLGAVPRGLARGSGRAAVASVLALAIVLALASPAMDAESASLSGEATTAVVAELPLAAGAAALLLAVAYVARARSLRVAPFAIAAILPAAAALGILTIAFHRGEGPLGLAIGVERVPASGALVAGLVAVTAIAAARGAAAIDAVRFERELDAGPPGVAERAAEIVMPAAALGTLLAGAAFGVLTGADLAAAEELGVLVAAGLLVDLVVVRGTCLAALARWSGPRHGREPGRRHLRIRWPRWRKPATEQGSTASPS